MRKKPLLPQPLEAKVDYYLAKSGELRLLAKELAIGRKRACTVLSPVPTPTPRPKRKR